MKNTNQYLLSLLSGKLIGLSGRYTSLVMLTWIAFIPLFIAIKNAKPKLAILLGSTTGIASSPTDAYSAFSDAAGSPETRNPQQKNV